MTPCTDNICEVEVTKLRVKYDDRCKKCKKVVRNGILCDSCDKWLHFRCGNTKKGSEIEDNKKWSCPQCIHNGDVNNEGKEDSTNDVSSLLEIVSILQNDLMELKSENVQLQERLNKIEKCRGSHCSELETTWSAVVRNKNAKDSQGLSQYLLKAKTYSKC